MLERPNVLPLEILVASSRLFTVCPVKCVHKQRACERKKHYERRLRPFLAARQTARSNYAH
jgi:hypothetical protein